MNSSARAATLIPADSLAEQLRDFACYLPHGSNRQVT
jgi:hypothetical protein